MVLTVNRNKVGKYNGRYTFEKKKTILFRLVLKKHNLSLDPGKLINLRNNYCVLW